MQKPKQIAIDGPAASGKTTVGRKLAEMIHYHFFDTGLVYRIATYAVIQQQIPFDSPERIAKAVAGLQLSLKTNPDTLETDVLLDSAAVGEFLHTPAVDEHVSKIAAIPEVRSLLTEAQREIGNQGDVVMVGRDIGTVVMPDAPLKVYLLASAEKRAERRTAENQAKGIPSDYQQILRGIQERDQLDSNRSVAPLKPAADALLIDTDTLTSDQVVAQILAAIG